MLQNFFYILFALYFLLLFSRITGFRILELATCTGAVILNLFILVYMYHRSGNLPVFNIFESFLLISFILGATGLFVLFRGDFSIKVRKWVWIEILVLFLIMSFSQKEVSPSLYDHSYIYIVLFHAFRCLALAFMLVATAWFIQFIIQREMNERTGMLAHQGRNYLVLAAVFFLMGEYVGIIWCQNGWGDFWSWSQAFFQSTLIVLYLMLAFHIPGKSRKAEDLRSMIGGLSGIFMLTLSILRSMY
jgi:hypothetical protein